jgi:hypothetical protein
MNKIFFWLQISFVYITLSGCKYKSTDSRYSGEKNVYIEIVENHTLAPQIGSLVGHKLREHILRRGHFNIVSNPKKGDFFVRIILKNYTKDSEIFDPQDTMIASGFRLNINAMVTLSNRNGKLLIEQAVVNEKVSVLRKDSLTKPLDRQAILSLSLGRQISQLIENFKW